MTSAPRAQNADTHRSSTGGPTPRPPVDDVSRPAESPSAGRALDAGPEPTTLELVHQLEAWVHDLLDLRLPQR